MCARPRGPYHIFWDSNKSDIYIGSDCLRLLLSSVQDLFDDDTLCHSKGLSTGSIMNKFLLYSSLLPFTSSTATATLLCILIPQVISQCSNEKLVVYQITVATHWSRENFPKQYPEFRPCAQFAKLIGRSHSEDFKIFQIGEIATEGMKKYAETGASDLLDEYSQGAAGVLDAFIAPAVGQGVGETETQFFLDSNHTHVSLVMRLIPSPDWFIGISSLDLCVGNEWIDSFAINVTHLYDAGTDSGYTFTAPNFATVPPVPISRITSQKPNHKASSLYYPDKESLPQIATIMISKLKEYSPWKPTDGEISSGSAPTLTDDTERSDVSNEISNSTVHVDAQSLKREKRRRFRKFKGSRVRDCRMSEWSKWSECSALCGDGVQYRTRSIIHHSRSGGAPCPPSTDKRLCSSEVDCRQNYFDW